MSQTIPSLKRDVTPYEIAKFLKEIHQIEVAPQRIYRDRQDGRIDSYRSPSTGKWMVSIDNAQAYIDRILSGSSKKENPW